MNEFLPYGRQWIGDEEIGAVLDVLRSDFLTQGPKVAEFERALAAYCGAEHALAVSSGTAALHVAYLAAGLGPGDEVVTSPITFAATANAAVYCGATPRFADIDPHTLDISPAALPCEVGDRTRIVAPVHFAGLPCEMEAVAEAAARAGAIVVEDACHALGATWRDSSGIEHRVGSCSHSAMAVLSFHPVKHVATGEGGAVLTNDEELYRRLLRLREHGIERNPEPSEGGWYYEMVELGFNYRLTDIQSALGLEQLAKADGWLARRRDIAHRYDAAFAGLPLETQARPEGRESALHLYVIEVEDRRRVYDSLRARGIGTQVHYLPVHLHPYYRERYGFARGDFPAAEAYYERALSLPLFPRMTDADVERVIADVREVLGGMQ